MSVKLQAAWGSKLALRVRDGVPETETAGRAVRFWLPRALGSRTALLLLLGGVVSLLAAFEMRTSWIESRIFSALAERMTYRVEPGPSPAITFPRSGPYNERLGYGQMPAFLGRLSGPFQVTAQARDSRLMTTLGRAGISPVFREKTQAGLQILDRDGDTLFAARYPERAYRDFDAIPPLVVDSLLFVENREILRR